MGLKLFTCQGGDILLPDKNLVLVSRQDGGNLVVTPSRDVWERSELNAVELMLWSYLVAATGRAMLNVLPQLEGGCINYWEAGNWALNEAADRQTTLMITHQIDTLSRWQTLWVMEAGKLVQQGNWQQLSQQPGAFSEMLKHRQQEIR